MRLILSSLTLFGCSSSWIMEYRCSNVDTLKLSGDDFKVDLKDGCFYVVVDTSSKIESLKISIGDLMVHGEIKDCEIGAGKIQNFGSISNLELGLGEFANVGRVGKVRVGVGKITNHGTSEDVNLGIGSVNNHGEISNLNVGIGEIVDSGKVFGKVSVGLGTHKKR